MRAVHRQVDARARPWAAPAAPALRVASSSCTPSASETASANHSFGGRDAASGEPRQRLDPDGRFGLEARRSAGRPSIRPSPATNRSISLRRASTCSRSASSRRSCFVSSATMPEITSADRLAPPGHDLLDRTDDLLARRALHQVADGAGAQHLEHGRAVLERGERDHPRVGRSARDLSRRSWSAARRHRDVDQRHVGSGIARRSRSPRRRRRPCRSSTTSSSWASSSASAPRRAGSSSAISTRIGSRSDAARATGVVGGSSDGHRGDATGRSEPCSST